MNILLLTSLGFKKSLLGIQEFLETRGHKASVLHSTISKETVENLAPDLIICHNYGSIISREIITAMKGNIINLHPSLLPHCRGIHPHIWSIISGAPIGVTIHFINSKIDKGAIIAQRDIALDWDTDTLRSSYEILQRNLENLFKEAWGNYKSWHRDAWVQPSGGSYFSKRDYEGIKDQIKSWDMTIAEFKREFRSPNL